MDILVDLLVNLMKSLSLILTLVVLCVVKEYSSILLINPHIGRRLNWQQIVLTDQRGSFQEAIHACKSLGLKLVRVESYADHHVLYRVAKARGIDRYWIDGNDIQNEGNWMNLDNQPMAYTGWDAGEPNNLGGNENCAEVKVSRNERLNDVNCNFNNAIICYR